MVGRKMKKYRPKPKMQMIFQAKIRIRSEWKYIYKKKIPNGTGKKKQSVSILFLVA